MGATQSSTVEKKTKTSEVNETITNFMSANTQTVSASGVTSQFNKVDVVDLNVGPGCEFKVFNKAEIEQVTTANLTVEQLAELETEVTSKLTEEFESKQKQVSDLGGGNQSSVSRSEIEKEVKNVTKTTFESDNYQKISASVVTIQNNEIKIKRINCVDGKFEVSNTAIIKQVTEAVMKDIKDHSSKSKILSKIDSEFKAVTDQEQKGLFGMLGGLWMILGIVAAIIVIVVMIVALSPGGQKAVSQMGPPSSKLGKMGGKK